MNDNRATQPPMLPSAIMKRIKILLLILADSSSLPSAYLDSDRLSS